MMLQNNISFDSYFGRVLDPGCYKTIEYLNLILGTNKNLDPGLYSSIFDLVSKYVEKLDPTQKTEYIQNLYLAVIFLFQKLKEANQSLENLLEPKTFNDYILLRVYLLPLLDLIAEIYPNALEVNRFTYEYIVNNELLENVNTIYVVENENSPSVRISSVKANEFKTYVEHNGLAINISGALMYNHETKKGLLSKFLDERLKLRKQYKKERDNYGPGTEDYKFYDKRQMSLKINANSSYGIMGLKSFRFSNKYLAKSTTLSGKLCLKTAQMFGELYLRNLEEQKNS